MERLPELEKMTRGRPFVPRTWTLVVAERVELTA